MHAKLIFLPLAALALAQTAQAHSSHSDGMQHASEHLWFLLIPAGLWLVASVAKKRNAFSRLRRKRDED